MRFPISFRACIFGREKNNVLMKLFCFRLFEGEKTFLNLLQKWQQNRSGICLVLYLKTMKFITFST